MWNDWQDYIGGPIPLMFQQASIDDRQALVFNPDTGNSMTLNNPNTFTWRGGGREGYRVLKWRVRSNPTPAQLNLEGRLTLKMNPNRMVNMISTNALGSKIFISLSESDMEAIRDKLTEFLKFTGE